MAAGVLACSRTGLRCLNPFVSNGVDHHSLTLSDFQCVNPLLYLTKINSCFPGQNYVPQNSYVEAPPPSSVTVFGDGTFREAIQVTGSPNNGVLIQPD